MEIALASINTNTFTYWLFGQDSFCISYHPHQDSYLKLNSSDAGHYDSVLYCRLSKWKPLKTTQEIRSSENRQINRHHHKRHCQIIRLQKTRTFANRHPTHAIAVHSFLFRSSAQPAARNCWLMSIIRDWTLLNRALTNVVGINFCFISFARQN